MQARILEELEFRRIVLGIGTLAAVFGAVVFVLAIARWQFDVVANRVLWITAAWGLVNLAAAWTAVRRLATYLEPREKQSSQGTRDNGKPGGRSWTRATLAAGAADPRRPAMPQLAVSASTERLRP